MSIPLIKELNIAGLAIRGDMPFPMIATRDVAKAASERLMRRGCSKSSVRVLLGQRDVSLAEAVRLIGAGTGKPDRRCVPFSYADTGNGLIAAGLSADVSRLFAEMSRTFNEGLVWGSTVRTETNTTGTSIGTFAETFAGIYKHSSQEGADQWQQRRS